MEKNPAFLRGERGEKANVNDKNAVGIARFLASIVPVASFKNSLFLHTQTSGPVCACIRPLV